MQLDFRPPVVHEIRVVLTAPFNPLSGTVRAFPVVTDSRDSGWCSPFRASVSPLIPTPDTTPSADFCRTITSLATCSVPIPETYDRPPKVSLTASRAQPPDLRSASLMDKDFAVMCQLVRRSRLISDFCSSAHAFATRFFQTKPRDSTLALR